MSIANAMNNAVSGLSAVSRGAEVAASNIANAMTPGYGRREVSLAARIHSADGGGVRIAGVDRVQSASLLSDLRLARAAGGGSQVALSFHQRIENGFGLPTDPGSLSGLLADLDAGLIAASSRPDSDLRLRAVLDGARAVATKLNRIGDDIQLQRSEADRQIGLQVELLNDSLAEVSRLNRQVIVEQANGRDASSLIDARQAAIDRIASIVPVREVARENGRVALFTSGGATLLDGKTPAPIGFQTAGRLAAGMTVGEGPVNRLTLDGEPLSPSQTALFAGGSLGALFELRDNTAPAMQARVDAIATELVERFSDPAIDPSLAGGLAGIFIDRGGPGLSAEGLSSRIGLNPLVDPEQGGMATRLRDGIHATLPADAGDASVLSAMGQALRDARPYASASASATSGTVSGLVGLVLSESSAARLQAASRQSHDMAIETSLQQAMSADGVDTDRELQALLQLENAYAANARVIQTIDALLEALLRI